jgi:uncharacterized RDD family membrane protein YckC
MSYCQKCGNQLTDDAKFCPKCGTPVEATSYAAPSAPQPQTGPRLAFWGERFVAWLIDVIIIGIIVGALSIFTWFSSGNFTWWFNWPTWVPFFNVGGVIYFLYWMLMDGAYGQSLGKMIMHLKVTRLDGAPINMGQAALESAGKAFLLPLDVLIGVIFYPRRRQRIFSYLAETIVVEESHR